MMLHQLPTSPQALFKSLLSGFLLILCLLLSACSLPQVSAEERLFLDLSLTLLGEYRLPAKTMIDETRVGGLSAIAYDRQRDRFYVVSDDRSEFAPARFYTLKLSLTTAPEPLGIKSIDFEKVTLLKNRDQVFYPKGSIDPEGLALSPRRSLFISSEGAARAGIPPFIDEFDLETGQWQSQLPIPTRFIPQTVDGQLQGVQDNLSFEALTINPTGSTPNQIEPFRLFAATEAPLEQDKLDPDKAEPNQPNQEPSTPDSPNASDRIRFLHYLVGDPTPTLLSEHLYLIEPPPEWALAQGLTEILSLDQAGHFLSLERSYGLKGFNARIFQLATGGATDISGVRSLKGDLSGLAPIRKQLVLDLAELNIPLDNLEGMTLGPRLPDGSQSLLLVSDDNFSDTQVTQFLLFRLQ